MKIDLDSVGAIEEPRFFIGQTVKYRGFKHVVVGVYFDNYKWKYVLQVNHSKDFTCEEYKITPI